MRPAILAVVLAASPCACSQNHTRSGRAALDRGDDVTAARHLGAAVGQDPDNANAWRDLARAHMRAGHPEPAAVAIGRAAALRPSAPDVVLLRGQIRMSLGDRDGALADAQTVLGTATSAPQLEQAAVLLVRLGEADLAVRAAARAVELSGGAAAAYGNLAVLAMELRRLDVAEQALVSGRARHPKDLPLAQTHAAFLLASGHSREAASIYRELLPRHPEPGLLHHALALIEHEAGRLDAAQRHADLAADAFGLARPDVLYTRIVILRDRGDLDEARSELRKALRRFPAHEALQGLSASIQP